MKGFVSFVVGFLFALGLGYSGMTQTHVVKGFLDILGNWNPNLIGVMIGAIMIHSLIYHFVKHKTSPLLDSQFYLPTKKDIDKKLLGGAAIFGLGWGWAGICPGPAIVSLASGELPIIIFVFSMFVGMGVFKLIDRK
jgi:uncharacterized membrane protein YedE/YeeE